MNLFRAMGAVTTSAAVSITVNAAPTVSLTSPANNATFTAPATITLTATALDSDGSIAKVDFFQGATRIAKITNAPYTFTLNNVVAGSYTFTARAFDNQGAAMTSSPLTISVVPPNMLPAVSLTAPADGASFKAPASLTLIASANDVDGTIAKVDFYQGATLLGTVTTALYTFTVNNLGQGSYTFSAVATDNRGGSTTSNTATITVTPAQAQVYYIYTDQLNTPRAITNQQNQIVWRWDNQDPFGANVPDEDPNNTGNHFTFNPRFPGQYFDKETNLNYNYFRDYDSSTGRYVQSDPIGLGGGLNIYNYSVNLPLLFTDSRGLAVFLVAHPAAQSSGTSLGVLINPAAYHLSIYIKPDCGSSASTIGGQPAPNPAPYSLGPGFTLVASFNNPNDLPGPGKITFKIDPPPGQSDSDFIANLYNAVQSYNSSPPLPYALPNNNSGALPPGGYNSNSFAAGVLKAAGSALPNLANQPFSVPGYTIPIPILVDTLITGGTGQCTCR